VFKVNDVFYLSVQNLEPKEIHYVFFSEYNAIYSDYGNSKFCIDFDDVHTEWHKMDISEFEDVDFLIRKEISTVYCISHRSKDLPVLVSRLKELLHKFGGIIGNDSDEFEPIFNYDNIDDFCYGD